MKRQILNTLIATLLCCILINVSQGQNIKYSKDKQKVFLISGDISILKDIKSLNVQYFPEKMMVGINGEPDSVYVRKKVNELNEKKNGKGDDWLNEWQTTKSYFLPAFIEGFNSISAKYDVNSENGNKTNEFTIELYPDLIYHYIDLRYLTMHVNIVSANNSTKPIAVFTFQTCSGKSHSKLNPTAFAGTFYNAGMILAKCFEKYLYKK